MREVPTLRGYFPEPVREEICWSDIKHIDKDVMSDCFRAVRKLLADLRGKGAPNNPMWDEGLPIFVAGGGRNLKVYWKALRKVDHWRGDHLRVAPFQMRELPSLEDLRAPNLSDEIGPRFAVAYGLSYPADDIGEIRPPHEIPDLDLDKKNTSFDTTDYKDTKAFT
jgi:hypothetical protein